LSVEGFDKFQQMEALLDGLILGDEPDSWQFPANAQQFRVDQSYKLLLGDSIPIPDITWLWKTCNQLKHKIIFWLLLNDRPNTRQLLQRKNFFIQNYTCTMCEHYVVESRDHLCFHCPFAQICWKNICPNWTALSAETRANWQSQASAESALRYGHSHSSCLSHLEYQE